MNTSKKRKIVGDFTLLNNIFLCYTQWWEKRGSWGWKVCRLWHYASLPLNPNDKSPSCHQIIPLCLIRITLDALAIFGLVNLDQHKFLPSTSTEVSISCTHFHLQSLCILWSIQSFCHSFIYIYIYISYLHFFCITIDLRERKRSFPMWPQRFRWLLKQCHCDEFHSFEQKLSHLVLLWEQNQLLTSILPHQVQRV